MYHMQHGV